jgi:hypothetical protein
VPDEERNDPLEELRERVKATQEAAERIMQEKVPPRGWAPPPSREAGEATSEMQTLVALLESLRDLLPPELREQVTALVKQLLLVLRALIDWLVDRLERGPRGAAPEVEDIPIA